MLWYWRGLVISSKQNVTDINVHDTITINLLIMRLNFSNAIFVYVLYFFLFTVVVSSKRATSINTTKQDYR